MLGYLGAISSYLGSMLGHVGGKMRQDSDQEHQVEPNMGGWRLPDGKCQGGVGGKLVAFGALQSTVLLLLRSSKTLRFKTLRL